jgi:hypothetical protein
MAVQEDDVVNAATCERIAEGMTRAEVVAIVGREPDEVRQGWNSTPTTVVTFGLWHGSRHSLSVSFSLDEKGEWRAGLATLLPRQSRSPFIDAIRAWLGF